MKVTKYIKDIFTIGGIQYVSIITAKKLAEIIINEGHYIENINLFEKELLDIFFEKDIQIEILNKGENL